MAKLITRELYQNQLEKWREIDVIKVITGVRRCGKSTIMNMFAKYLQENGVDPANIVKINFEEYENVALTKDSEIAYYNIINKLDKSKMNYVFLDEVQNVQDFEKLLDALYVKDYIDLYITGSNAYLLSSELATLLTGRKIEIHVLPFSFAEYKLALNAETSNYELFQNYLQFGGMPGVVGIENNQSFELLNNIFQDVVEKDALFRNHLNKNNEFQRTVKFLLDSSGSPISLTKITNTFKSSNISISHNTIDKYIRALTESYLFYKVPRFDLKGKKILSTNEKYYPVDVGFRNSILEKSTGQDLGHSLETIVFLELKRRMQSVNIGKVADKEIDFVAKGQNEEKAYYQVAYSTTDQNTLKRELSSFMIANDYTPRFLLTTDPGIENFNGIKRMSVIDWLLTN